METPDSEVAPKEPPIEEVPVEPMEESPLEKPVETLEPLEEPLFGKPTETPELENGLQRESPRIEGISPKPSTAIGLVKCEHDGPSKRPSSAVPQKRHRDEDDDMIFATMSLPPPPLTDSAVYNRMYRIFQRKKDGSKLVDDRWCEAWADTRGGGRESVKAMFEKVGYNPDGVENNMSGWECSRILLYKKIHLVFKFYEGKKNSSTERPESQSFVSSKN